MAKKGSTWFNHPAIEQLKKATINRSVVQAVRPSDKPHGMSTKLVPPAKPPRPPKKTK